MPASTNNPRYFILPPTSTNNFLTEEIEVELKAYKLSSSATSCIETETRNDLELKLTKNETAEIFPNHYSFRLRSILVQCRSEFNSQQFPDNPRNI